MKSQVAIKMIREHLKKYLSNNTRRFIRRVLQAPEKLRFYLASKNILTTVNHKGIGELKNKHLGKRCFIIGSGPSINKMNLKPLQNEITFGFNGIFHIADKIGFMPSYYLIEDPLPAEDNAEKVNSIRSTIKIFPNDLKYCLKPDENTIYVYFDRCYGDYPERDFPRFSDDAMCCIYWGGTVAYMALQLAFYMGFQDVFLVGIDLNYKVLEDVKGNVIVSTTDDVNHFHPSYFGVGKRWHLPKVERMKVSFEKAYDFFNKHNRTIYNATMGGKLDTLPRKDFSALFK